MNEIQRKKLTEIVDEARTLLHQLDDLTSEVDDITIALVLKVEAVYFNTVIESLRVVTI